MEDLLKEILVELKEIRTDVKVLRTDVDELKSGQLLLEKGQKEIKEAVLRLESSQPKDIWAILERIDKKLVDRDFEVYALNKRVFMVEAEVERLNSQ